MSAWTGVTETTNMRGPTNQHEAFAEIIKGAREHRCTDIQTREIDEGDVEVTCRIYDQTLIANVWSGYYAGCSGTLSGRSVSVGNDIEALLSQYVAPSSAMAFLSYMVEQADAGYRAGYGQAGVDHVTRSDLRTLA
eukprot:TRINITY_DN22233_c0_g1_i1.p1 TRINITY_DN22233_c0_g1~~TRINITY_DN22233_c0_g1_i1.p1  ORF type:complete len:136 (-),score=24.84 TRINITY_DN22233_c0_g1_i1:110-517(-)